MSISSVATRKEFAGDGSTTAFVFPYLFAANADLVVVERDDTTLVDTTKTITTHYTVSGAGTGSGTVTAVVAPATGKTWIVELDPAATQATDLVANDALPAATIEDALDKLSILVRELTVKLGNLIPLRGGQVTVATAAITLVDADGGKLIACDATTAAFTVTLPAISALTRPWEVAIRKTDSGANAITVARAGSDTIEGDSTISLATQNKGVILKPNHKTKWYKILTSG